MVDLFQKMYNYQLRQKLQHCRQLLLTADERSWLKWCLDRPESAWFLDQNTVEELRQSLSETVAFNPGNGLSQKGIRLPAVLKTDLFRYLQQMIRCRQGMQLQYCLNDGSAPTAILGMPCFLEYSLVRQEWYLLWVSEGEEKRVPLITPLRNIEQVKQASISLSYDAACQVWTTIWTDQQQEMLLELLPGYDEERSRILHALSAFSRKINRDDNDRYQVIVYYLADEEEYLLQKIRRLGNKVKIISPEHLRQRMLATAARALERYHL